MPTRLHTSAALAPLLACAALAGCQTYDFEPVPPTALSVPSIEKTIAARGNTPNLMLLVDTSGSMLEPMNSANPICRSPTSGVLCLGEGCPAGCPTRWSALQGAMSSFLGANGAFARIGLALYPGKQLVLGEQCGGTDSLTLDLPADDNTEALQTHAEAVKAELHKIPNHTRGGPEGGTPTGASLLYVGSQPQLQTDERSDFVLLLTDGLPNCNENNTSLSCRCNKGECTDPYEWLGCLDQDGSVSAVRTLRGRDIQTIVIGFGADTASGDGPAVLNAMAEAGGFARKCQADADCGTGDACDTRLGLCQRRYYQAANQDELATALRQISERFEGNPCLIELAHDQFPPSPGLARVLVNGEGFGEGDDTWRLKPGVGVELLGSLCARVQGSSPAHPVRIEVRVVIPR
ncbi:adventurous gliding motility lipoprotein CglB [Archangium lansingense]|uniref:Adventurous gliding motility lipoprotein CglB n=1 Tax=Archangium lansingense TaxID=2995310 RepID=A0ABT3ZW18_9BACT|nr:adventurous gliding motility lipoprotein CglB [Archangium lansinium]MCY1073561.1 adventurous gliding motility lipoprotein CglB [Archangium lansinium]